MILSGATTVNLFFFSVETEVCSFVVTDDGTGIAFDVGYHESISQHKLILLTNSYKYR